MHDGEVGPRRHTGAGPRSIVFILWHELQNQRLHGRRITSVVALQEVITARDQVACHQFEQWARMQWTAQSIPLRMTEFADMTGLCLRLIYYPHYLSKYNAIERYWAGLEKSWNGYLLSTVASVINRAVNFCWKGMRTVACLVDAIYKKGQTMRHQEKRP